MLEIILKGMQLVPALIAAKDDFKAMIDAFGDTLGSDDQEALKSAYADHIEDSDAAHRRFQALLDKAAQE